MNIDTAAMLQRTTNPTMYLDNHQDHNPSATEPHPSTNIHEDYPPKTFIPSHRTILRHGN
jgi:hypothetical protein